MDGIPEDIRMAAREVAMTIGSDSIRNDSATIAIALLAERERIATKLFRREALMTAVSGEGDPYVKISFKSLKDMQAFHSDLYALSEARKLR